MQTRHVALLLGIAAAEFYEPCTPAQALQALHKVRSLDAASDAFKLFCQACPQQNSTAVCCGCFAGLLALEDGIQHELTTLKVLHQADVNKLQNLSATLQVYRVKLRSGPGLATARAALQDKFTDLQRRIGFTGQVALRLADERRIDSLTDRTAGLMSEVFFYFKELHTMPLYAMLVENHNTCLLDIFAGRCEKRNLPIFEKFPAVQGPPSDGFMLDFLGVSMPIEASCQEPQLALLAPGRTMMLCHSWVTFYIFMDT